MEDRIGEDEYEELGEEQKVAIGRWFLMNAPPGQVLQVAKGINNLFVLALYISRSLDVVSISFSLRRDRRGIEELEDAFWILYWQLGRFGEKGFMSVFSFSKQKALWKVEKNDWWSLRCALKCMTIRARFFSLGWNGVKFDSLRLCVCNLVVSPWSYTQVNTTCSLPFGIRGVSSTSV